MRVALLRPCMRAANMVQLILMASKSIFDISFPSLQVSTDTLRRLSTETGMARLSLDDSDKKVRDWFMKEAKSLGCETSIDQMGNLFAIRAGKNKDMAPIMMGSHLDTQPTGGRYDGILGVVSGLEVLRVLNENSWETEGSIGVVNWTK